MPSSCMGVERLPRFERPDGYEDLRKAVDTCRDKPHAIRLVCQYWQKKQLSLPAYRMQILQYLSMDKALTESATFDLHRYSIGPFRTVQLIAEGKPEPDVTKKPK